MDSINTTVNFLPLSHPRDKVYIPLMAACDSVITDLDLQKPWETFYSYV